MTDTGYTNIFWCKYGRGCMLTFRCDSQFNQETTFTYLTSKSMSFNIIENIEICFKNYANRYWARSNNIIFWIIWLTVLLKGLLAIRRIPHKEASVVRREEIPTLLTYGIYTAGYFELDLKWRNNKCYSIYLKSCKLANHLTS